MPASVASGYVRSPNRSLGGKYGPMAERGKKSANIRALFAQELCLHKPFVSFVLFVSTLNTLNTLNTISNH